MKHFVPISPDPYLKKRKGDGALARFGHLNVIVDKLNEADGNQSITALAGGGQVGAIPLIVGFNLVTSITSGDSVILPSLAAICACTGGCGPIFPVTIKNEGPGTLTIYPFLGENLDGLAINVPLVLDPGSSVSFTDMDCNSWESFANSTDPAFTGINSVTGCLVDNTDPANPIIDDILVGVAGPTQALTGDGCTTPLSVCIDNDTITLDANGCLQALGNAPLANCGYPIGAAESFVVLTGAALTVGLPAQPVSGDVGYVAPLIGSLVHITGADFPAPADAAAIADATALEAFLAGLPTTNPLLTAAPLEGQGPLANGTFFPGVYKTAAITALNIGVNGIINLNGDGCYVFYADGAFTTGANTVINLTNGAKASKVFWVTTGALTTGSNTIFKGTFVSSAGYSTGAPTFLEGRLLSPVAAGSLGAGAGQYYLPLA